MKAPVLFFSLMALAAIGIYLLVPSGSGADRILRVSDRARVSISQIVPDLAHSELVFVGEQHDETRHHRLQLEVIRRLKESGTPVAIGLEMFRKESQPELDRWVSGQMDEASFRRVFSRDWGYDWALYSDIFRYAREHRIPLVGLNVPREITQQVAKEGFASMTPEQVRQLPKVQCEISPEYEAFMRRVHGVHQHGGSSFTHFCEAQLVWDAAMAHNLVEFIEQYPEFTVVVLAGNGHAWKPGIPEQVRRLADITYRVLVPELPGGMDPQNVTTAEADYLWVG